MKIEKILTNPWENVYWFSRMLINSDKYSGIGSDSQTMLAVSSAIKSVIEDGSKNLSEDDKIEILSRTAVSYTHLRAHET